MRAYFVIVASVMALSVLVLGCNTMEGTGKDVEHLGKEIQEEAR